MGALSLCVNVVVFLAPLTCFTRYERRWKELIRFRRGPTVSDITDEMIALERNKDKEMQAIATIFGFSTLALWLIYRIIKYDLFNIVLGCCCIGATQLVMHVIERGLKKIDGGLDECDNVVSEGDLSINALLPGDTLSGKYSKGELLTGSYLESSSEAGQLKPPQLDVVIESNEVERDAIPHSDVMPKPNETDVEAPPLSEVMPKPNEAERDAPPQSEVMPGPNETESNALLQLEDMPEPNEAESYTSPRSEFMPKPNEEQRDALMRLEKFVIAIKNTPPTTLAIYGPAVTDMLDVIQATAYPTELFEEAFTKIISLSINYVRASLINSTAAEQLNNDIHSITPIDCRLREDSKRLMKLKSNNAQATEGITRLQAQLKQLLDVRNALDEEISVLTENIEDLRVSQEKLLRRMDALDRRIQVELKEQQQADTDFELHESDYLDSINSSIQDLITSLEALF